VWVMRAWSMGLHDGSRYRHDVAAQDVSDGPRFTQ